MRRIRALFPMLLMLLLASPLAAMLLLPAPAAGQDTVRGVMERLGKLAPDQPVELVIERATGTGVGVTSSGDKIDSTLHTDAPAVLLPPGSATGGGSDGRVRIWSQSVSPSAIALAVLGALSLGLAVLCVVRQWGLPRAPIVFAASGVGLLAAAAWPGAALWVCLGIFAAVAGVHLFSEAGATRFREALRAAAAGVAGLPADVRGVVTAEISKHADARDKATIKAIKRRDDL